TLSAVLAVALIRICIQGMASTLHKCETARFYHHGAVLSWFAHDVEGYGGFCRLGTGPGLHYAGEDDRFSLNALLKFRHLSLPPSGGIFFICTCLPGKQSAR
ncbi:MAG: hypothetical protein ACRDC0_15910, partial [Aeromonas veronii]